MEKKKENEIGQSKTIVSNTSAEFSKPTFRAPSELNIQIADLLFEMQGDDKKDHILQTRPEKVKADAKQMLSEKQTEEPRFLGVMGKCMIPGCDIHILTLEGVIVEHFKSGQPIGPAFHKARELLANATSNTVGIMVYDNKVEIIFLDGSVKKV